MSETNGALPVIWFDRPVDEMQTAVIGGRAEIAHSTDDDPLAQLERAEAAIVGAAISYDENLFAQAPKLRVIVRAGIGYDNVNLEDATKFGIAAANTPDGPTTSTAEHAVALIFAATKGLKEAVRRLERAESNFWARHNHLELAGARLALLGLGRIGAAVGKTMAAVGMEVVAYDPFVAEDKAAELGVRLAATPLEAVSGADVISVHAPLTDETKLLVSAELLAAAKPGAYLVNTSRGGLVDQDALLAALDSGQIRGAGLDVTDPEPLPPDHPLLGREDVVVTPHVASSTGVGRRRIFEHAATEAFTALGGTAPANLLNPQVWPGRNS